MEEQVRKSHRKQFSQMRILYSLTMRNIVKTKRTLFLSLIALAPAIITVIFILQRLTNTDSGTGFNFYTILMSTFQIRGVLLILTVFYGSTVFTDEIDRKTLVYLQGRPISGWAMIVGKYLPAVVVSSSLIIISTIICYVPLMWIDGKDAIFGNATILLRDLGAMIIGAFAYIALMLLLSLLFKKPVIWGLVFTLGWENTVVNIPGPIHKVTILHWIESIYPHVNVTNEFLAALHPSSSPISTSIQVLVVLTLIFLAVSIYMYKTKEFSFNE
ncbi:MAG: ABC transporter permease [Acidobacteria bacterium]|nr:ABC transporter permease [Acidobacteriota bacterium]